MAAAMINELAATVPTTKCIELPKSEYIRGGTKLESVYEKTDAINSNTPKTPEHSLQLSFIISNRFGQEIEDLIEDLKIPGVIIK
ncbi:hypothetical protein L2E82_34509 [Cichorium intybus]|uniref:Uncharacterized protein n=1 Tax=Cichorium intybus TaxID=13427 RepID=A0ACB9BM80_CICIN|nr:hypothetical protein L2E82_34509 [Cichorium intybus]